MAKKSSPYFDDFIDMVECSCRAAEHLKYVFEHFSPETLDKNRTIMHEMEHQGDQIKHTMINRLVKEFVPPIDREDIMALADHLDDVIDKIDDILIRIYMYNIQSLRPEASAFADVILRCCQALRIAVQEFPNFHKSTTLMQAIIDVNSMEEEGDALYIRAVRTLYEKGGDPVEISAWSELFDRLEDCCDTCEHVADLMETVVLKNA